MSTGTLNNIFVYKKTLGRSSILFSDIFLSFLSDQTLKYHWTIFTGTRKYGIVTYQVHKNSLNIFRPTQLFHTIFLTVEGGRGSLVQLGEK